MKLGDGQLFPDKWSACGVSVPSPPDALAPPTPSKDSGAPAVAGYTTVTRVGKSPCPSFTQVDTHLFLRPINCYDDRF